MVELARFGLLALALISLLSQPGCATTQADCKEPAVLAPAEVDAELGARKRANIDKRRAGPPLGRPFRASATGQGLLRLGQIEVVDNKAAIEIDGHKGQGFVYTTQDWQEYGYTLLDVIITEGGAYTVLYLYCRAGKLTDVYWESYDDDLQYEKLSGTCKLDPQITRTEHTFERVKPPIGGLVQGFTVKGPNIAMESSGEGTLTLMNTTYNVRAFSFVGCTDCVNAQRKGWEELHVWLGAEDQDCFGVLYLYSDAAAQGLPMGGQAAQLGYGFCTHPVKDLPNTLFRATWTR